MICWCIVDGASPRLFMALTLADGAFSYRGHNELDEPAFTQPLMYQTIRSRKSVPTLYEDKLLVCLFDLINQVHVDPLSSRPRKLYLKKTFPSCVAHIGRIWIPSFRKQILLYLLLPRTDVNGGTCYFRFLATPYMIPRRASHPIL